MTYEQFRKYSKDIEDENMSDKMIKELFLGIKEKQLALHDLAKRIEKKKQLQNLTEAKHQDLYQKEKQEILNITKQQIL